MISVKESKTLVNIAEKLSKEELQKISAHVLDGLRIDEASREEWLELAEKAMELAKMKTEPKNDPWEGAANIKYPLIADAAIRYAARTLPQIVQSNKVVRTAVVGLDPDGEKFRRGKRVETHMSYMLLQELEDWEDQMDKLLHVKAIVGLAYKKTYYDEIDEQIVSELCYPDAIVVNQDIKSLKKAPRISHLITKSTNEIVEGIRAGVYSDIDLEKLEDQNSLDSDAPVKIVEQHCYLDLDKDGYKEPYIVTLHKESGEILNISHRFKKIKYNKKGEIRKITPIEFFTDFHFIKALDGSFHSIGLGTLLYSTNKAINTLFNQLIDSGTLNNHQSGFIGKGVRLRNGDMKLKMGEWKVLEASIGDDLKNNIIPLPTKEPSGTLFQLLGLLIETGKELANINEVLQGSQPAQNVPATTILTLVEQGLQVFNAVQKRLFRSLKSEETKIFELIPQYVSQEHYQMILDDPTAFIEDDYNSKDLDIRPVANPNMSSTAQKLGIAQALLSLPTLDPYEQTKTFLEALDLEQTEIDKLLPKPGAKPPSAEEIKAQIEVQKLQAEIQKLQIEAQVASESNVVKAQGLEIQQLDAQTRAMEAQARIGKMASDKAVNEAKTVTATESSLDDAQIAQAKLAIEREKNLIQAGLKQAELQNKDKKDS